MKQEQLINDLRTFERAIDRVRDSVFNLDTTQSTQEIRAILFETATALARLQSQIERTGVQKEVV